VSVCPTLFAGIFDGTIVSDWGTGFGTIDLHLGVSGTSVDGTVGVGGTIGVPGGDVGGYIACERIVLITPDEEMLFAGVISPDGMSIDGIYLVKPSEIEGLPVGDAGRWHVDLGDTDGDGCLDAQELGGDWHSGGQRDRTLLFDVFDVPAPAGPAMGGDGRLILAYYASRNRAVSLQDVTVVLSYVGRTSGNPAYGQDNNYDGMSDGPQLDRRPSIIPGEPWHARSPDGAISLQDVAVALAQVGTNCN
jgi:hypothetical protein